MKITYHKDTDSLFIHLNDRASSETKAINDDINVDLDKSGQPTGIEFHQNAAKYIDLTSMEIKSFPTDDVAIAA